MTLEKKVSDSCLTVKMWVEYKSVAVVIKSQTSLWIPRTTRGASGSANKEVVHF